MDFIRRISGILGLHRKKELSEEAYYTNLFTRDPLYSTRTPNEEELERWNHISTLISIAKSRSGQNHFHQIIDFGCGRGWLTNLLATEGKVTGIEPVEQVVQYGKKLYPSIDLRHGDISLLEELKANLIVCSEVIEHISKTDLPGYFQIFFQCLENDGFLMITSPRMEVYDQWEKYSPPGQPVESWLYENEIQQLAEDAGFIVVEKIVYGEKPRYDMDPIDVYQQWLFKKPGIA